VRDRFNLIKVYELPDRSDIYRLVRLRRPLLDDYDSSWLVGDPFGVGSNSKTYLADDEVSTYACKLGMCSSL
jgi:hypothetical protein